MRRTRLVKQRPGAVLTTALACVAVAVMLTSVPAHAAPPGGILTARAPSPDAADRNVPDRNVPDRATHEWQRAFEAAAHSAQESVVAITASQAPRDESSQGGVKDLPRRLGAPFADRMRGFFESEFLDRFFFDRPPRTGGTEQALGSGVIVGGGHVLTNEHVVAGAGELTVWLAGDRKVKARVVGTDPGTDLAVLKLEPGEAGRHRPATLADSDALRVGQWVLAVGKTTGDQVTATAGIVSATGRTASSGSVHYEDLIQTDAAIGPVQSGGPLVNLRGEVVGIATAVRSRSAGNPAMGLAIPSNVAKQMLDRLVSGGQVARGWLGVGVQELNDGLASSFGYDRSRGRGILVGDVFPDGPAAKAGLKSGDIIVRLDGKDPGDLRAFSDRVAGLKPGTAVPVEVWRNGQARTLEVRVGEAPAPENAHLAGARQSAAPDGQDKPDAFGLSLTDPTPQLRRQAGIDDEAAGAFITAVAPGSLAAALDLRPGDLVLEVQGKAVEDAAEARAEIAKLDPADGMRLRVRRGDVTRFVFLKLSP